MSRTPTRPSSYIKTIWRSTVSPYVRLLGCLKTTGTRIYGNCYTCGRTNIPFEELEAGHCIAKYGHAAVELEEDNIRPQCHICNDVKRGNGMRATFEANLRKEIGNQRVDRLILLSKQTKRWTLDELQKIKQEYETKKEKLLQVKGLI